MIETSAMKELMLYDSNSSPIAQKKIFYAFFECLKQRE